MKIINYILHLAGFENANDFLGSYHYHFANIFTISITIGSLIGFVETYSGVSFLLWIFMILGTVADLIIGVIANLFYLNHPFETKKFMRGIFKAFVLFVIIFITNLLKIGIEYSKISPEAIKTIFTYITATIHYSFVLLIGLYILLSIVENLAKMKIRVAISLASILKMKIKSIENFNQNEKNNPTTNN